MEKEKMKFSSLKILLDFMKGSRALYFGSVIAVGVAALVSLLNPLVIRITVDSMIGGKPLENVPQFLLNLIESAGGISELAKKLWIVSGVIILITAFNGMFLYYKGKWSAMASESISMKLRDKLYDHLQHMSYEYHVKAETGDLIQRCTSDVETIRRFLATEFVEIGRALFMIALVIPIMLSLNTTMTYISMGAIPFIFAYSFIFFTKVQKAFHDSDESEGRLSNTLQENLSGVRVVRAFARQSHEIDKFDEKNSEFRDLTYKVIYLMGWYWGVSDFLCLLQIGAVIVVGTVMSIQGVITIGTLMVFSSYVGMLLWPVRQMGRILTNLGKTMVAVKRIREILDEPIEEFGKTSATPEITGNIIFDNVSFEYEKDKPVLEGLSFNVKKGQTVAILGATGSGKSSLVHLLSGLYAPTKGKILIDDEDITSIYKKWLRKNVGIVLQEPFLYSKTIKDNIGLSVDSYEDKDVFSAAETACVHDVIMNFEKGYETAVGEKGVTLSGGQKQRVAIARTILNDSPILIFDDSLSAVDTETDASIRKALSERSRDVTTFIISHRVTTLAQADVILVLEHGRIVQKGSHDELISVDGIYKNIWSIQNRLEDELVEDINVKQRKAG